MQYRKVVNSEEQVKEAKLLLKQKFSVEEEQNHEQFE